MAERTSWKKRTKPTTDRLRLLQTGDYHLQQNGVDRTIVQTVGTEWRDSKTTGTVWPVRIKTTNE